MSIILSIMAAPPFGEIFSASICTCDPSSVVPPGRFKTGAFRRVSDQRHQHLQDFDISLSLLCSRTQTPQIRQCGTNAPIVMQELP